MVQLTIVLWRSTFVTSIRHMAAPLLVRFRRARRFGIVYRRGWGRGGGGGGGGVLPRRTVFPQVTLHIGQYSWQSPITAVNIYNHEQTYKLCAPLTAVIDNSLFRCRSCRLQEESIFRFPQALCLRIVSSAY